MPTTPNGTAWTSFSTTVPGASTVRWARPDALAASPIPALLYFHGAGGASNQFETLTAWTGLREWALDHGWGWIEGSMGGSNAWGNPATDTASDTAFAYVDGILDISAVVVLGRSMGGLGSARAYHRRRATDPRFVGLMVNSGVQDLLYAYTHDDGRWESAINSAWGVTDLTGFTAAATGYNPIDGPASSWDGANVLQLWGTDDDLVIPADNGIAMRTMYAGHPAIDAHDIRVGGDHSGTNGSYLQVDAMTTFMQTVLGETPTPPDPGTAFRAISTRLRTGGAMYDVTL